MVGDELDEVRQTMVSMIESQRAAIARHLAGPEDEAKLKTMEADLHHLERALLALDGWIEAEHDDPQQEG